MSDTNTETVENNSGETPQNKNEAIDLLNEYFSTFKSMLWKDDWYNTKKKETQENN